MGPEEARFLPIDCPRVVVVMVVQGFVGFEQLGDERFVVCGLLCRISSRNNLLSLLLDLM